MNKIVDKMLRSSSIAYVYIDNIINEIIFVIRDRTEEEKIKKQYIELCEQEGLKPYKLKFRQE